MSAIADATTFQSVGSFETVLSFYAKQLAEHVLREVRSILATEKPKEWYSTDELAAALGKARWTVQEKWCNAGRIKCEKDPSSLKWRIPGYEYERLVNGGSLLPKSI